MDDGSRGFKEGMRFVLYVCTAHVVSYFVVGIAAFSLLDYAALFLKPVVSDYYRPAESLSSVIGPFVQIARGLIFGLVLLPFRRTLEESGRGWLWLWLLFVGVGILGTPAAAPSSIEGMVYTKLPLWFHAIGYPEIMIQTLLFSLAVHRKLRRRSGAVSPALKRFLEPLSVACIAFVGYTLVSLGFAFAAGVAIDGKGADFRVLGQFLAPLALIILASLGGKRRIVATHAALYLGSVAALGAYQGFVLGSVGIAYVIFAPVLPTLLSFILNRRR